MAITCQKYNIAFDVFKILIANIWNKVCIQYIVKQILSKFTTFQDIFSLHMNCFTLLLKENSVLMS